MFCLTRSRRTTSSSRRHWEPSSLSTLALTATFAVFVSLLVSLLLLRYAVNHGSGFVLISRNSYTWVYGPTALLVIVTSFWRQIDYHCKALRPWSELQKGPSTADRTLLLDLVSPFQLVTLYHASTKGHYAVAMTIVGFLVLKLSTIASTGLLNVITITTGPVNSTLVYTSQLNNGTVYGVGRQVDLPFSEAAVPYTTYAIVGKGLPFSDGTTGDLAYDTFDLVDRKGFSKMKYSAEVRAFVPQVICEPVQLDLNFNWTYWSAYKNRVQAYESFTFRNNSRWTCARNALSGVMVYTNIPSNSYCFSRQVVAARGLVDCWPTGGTRKSGVHNITTYLLGLADIRVTQMWNRSMENVSYGDMVTPTNWTFQVPEIKALMCQVNYTVQARRVTYDATSAAPLVSSSLQSSAPGRKLNGFTDSNLTHELHGAFTGTHAGADMFGAQYQYIEQPPDSLFRMMSAHAGGDYKLLISDTEIMRRAAQDVITQTAVQVAKQGLFKSNNSTLIGELTYNVERLQLQSTSVYIMSVGFAVMAVITLTICYTKPSLEMPQNPGIIATQAEILSHSPALFSMVSQMALLNESKAHQILKRTRYSIQGSIKGGIRVSAILQKTNPVTINNTTQRRHTWWVPMTMSKVFLAITLCLPLLAIALLEFLQHRSDTSNGLTSLQDATAFKISVYTKFLPALVMLLIATGFNCFDFNTLLLEPFRAFREVANSPHILTRPLLSQFTPLAFFDSLRMLRWAAVCTSIAAFVGSGLTIAASGLYSVRTSPLIKSVPIQIDDVWNLNYVTRREGASPSTLVASLLETVNVSYPDFTYNELVFPRMSLSEPLAPGLPASLIRLRVPALRAELKCEQLPPERVVYNTTRTVNSTFVWTSVSANFSLPSNCRRGSQFGNESFLVTEPEIWDYPGYSEGQYLGRYYDVHVGPWNAGNGTATGVGYADQPDNPLGCPSSAVVYGRRRSNTTDAYYSAALCYQMVHSIDTDVTLTFPDLKIPSTHLPVPDESTIRNATDVPGRVPAFPWRLQFNLENYFMIFNSTATRNVTFNKIFKDEGDGEYAGHGMFVGTLAGKTPLTQQEMLDPTKFWPHLQMFYRRYMAQLISDNMRTSVSASDQYAAQDIIVTTRNITGTLLADGQLSRLVQHKTPKLVLQIMLAVMCLCGVLAWAIGEQTEIVPWNPCTIAGVMVLFAGSRMMHCGSEPMNSGISSGPVHETNSSDAALASAPAESTTEIVATKMPAPRISQLDIEERTHLIPRKPVPRSSLTIPSLAPIDSETTHMIPRKPVPMLLEVECSDKPMLDPISDSGSSDTADDKWKNANIRLGWWRDSTFMGKTGPPAARTQDSLIADEDGPEVRSEWRYGFDVLL